jgi:hypothetical protein
MRTIPKRNSHTKKLTTIPVMIIVAATTYQCFVLSNLLANTQEKIASINQKLSNVIENKVDEEPTRP